MLMCRCGGRDLLRGKSELALRSEYEAEFAFRVGQLASSKDGAVARPACLLPTC